MILHLEFSLALHFSDILKVVSLPMSSLGKLLVVCMFLHIFL